MKAKVIDFLNCGDGRGQLASVESGITVPFEIKRVYYIYGTRPGVERGFHAHKTLQQVAVAVSGSCEMVLDDGTSKTSYKMDSPQRGIYIHPGVWRVMCNFSDDCVLLVFADQVYDESDYIRDYKAFLSWKNRLDD